jgi:hypothetical protein
MPMGLFTSEVVVPIWETVSRLPVGIRIRHAPFGIFPVATRRYVLPEKINLWSSSVKHSNWGEENWANGQTVCWVGGLKLMEGGEGREGIFTRMSGNGYRPVLAAIKSIDEMDWWTKNAKKGKSRCWIWILTICLEMEGGLVWMGWGGQPIQGIQWIKWWIWLGHKFDEKKGLTKKGMMKMSVEC